MTTVVLGFTAIALVVMISVILEEVYVKFFKRRKGADSEPQHYTTTRIWYDLGWNDFLLIEELKRPDEQEYKVGEVVDNNFMYLGEL